MNCSLAGDKNVNTQFDMLVAAELAHARALEQHILHKLEFICETKSSPLEKNHRIIRPPPVFNNEK